MTGDTLIRTEGDYISKWKELKKMKETEKEKEQKGHAGLGQSLEPLLRNCPAHWLEGTHMPHSLFVLPLRQKDVNWGQKEKLKHVPAAWERVLVHTCQIPSLSYYNISHVVPFPH